MSPMEHNGPRSGHTANDPAAATPDERSPAAGPPPSAGGGGGDGNGDNDPSKLAAIYKSTTSFMALVGKEWLGSLINQAADPPFSFDTSFPDGSVRIMRLVVMTVFLTGLVVLSERFFSKNTPTLVVSMAVKVVIGTFLAAIVYAVFAFVCGVRVYQTPRRRLTLGQVFFSFLELRLGWWAS